ncbi:MAG TPA: glycosyltransferase, partial [Candidatus Limnocylindria bacterium]
MRIALVSDWTAPRLGGIEGQVNGLAAQLRERGHAVSVITVTPGPDALDGVIVHRLAGPVPPGWRGLQRALERAGMELGDPVPPALVRRLAAILQDERIDVVHAHSLWSPLGAMAIKLARDRGVAAVVTNHSLLERASLLFFRAY